ncbi:hypothetical protein [Niallia taxi]|uniref:hypothetical protein n=1 Tax=Niallia taxi TaxID=2499688 RepID=UPI00300A9B5B
MNLSEIKVGNEYKNYKELCLTLNEPVKKGNSKKAQIKQWKCYFNYENNGHKFIITDVFNTPKDKYDLRTQGNNKSFHIEYIEILLLDLLLQDKYKGSMFISRNKILRLLEMINDNYAFFKYKPSILLKDIGLEWGELNDFYTTTDDLLKRNLETALTSLEKKRLIFWNKSMTVCFVETELKKNDIDKIQLTKRKRISDDGELIVTFDVEKDIIETHRKATEEEIRLILTVEREILNFLCLNDMSDVFKYKKEDIFYDLVNDQLLERGNINYYYRSYDIIANEADILKQWKDTEELKLSRLARKQNKNLLNSSVIEKIELNAAQRHLKAKEESTLKEDHVKLKVKLRANEDYLTNTNRLTTTLINNATEKMF